MLYPLSYEGAPAQSSDLGLHLRWRGAATSAPASRTPMPGADRADLS